MAESRTTSLIRRRAFGLSAGLGGVGRIWALNAALIAAGGAVYLTAVSALPPLGLTARIPWPALAIAFCCTEIFVVHLHFRRASHSFSLTEIPLVVGLYFLAPKELLLAQLVGAGVALVLHRRQSAIKLCFNLAHFCLETGLAVLVFRAVYDGPVETGTVGNPLAWLATFLAVVTATVVSAVTIFLAISLSERRLEVGKLGELLITAHIVAGTNTSLALIGAMVFLYAPTSAWLLLVPAVTLVLAYRAYIAEREKHHSLEFLYESTRVLHRSTDLEPAILALLCSAREMFRADVAEITLFPEAEGETAFRIGLGPDDRTEVMTPVELEASMALWANVVSGRQALLVPPADKGHKNPGLVAACDVRDAMVTALHGETRVVGTMVVANRLGDAGTFGSDDLQLFETLANHVSITLEKGRLEQSLAQLRALEDQLTHQAFHDSLTQLANRALFTDRVERALRSADRGAALRAVLFVDLDDFKTINDSLGHPAGDELLVKVAERLRSCLRGGDTAARLGGDEFAVLIETMRTPKEAVALAERLIATLRAPFPLQGTEVSIDCSIGIAVSSSEEDKVDELLSNADVAMYAAKSRGKGRYELFEPNMRLMVLKRHEYNAALQRALDHQEFVLHYQPIVDLAANTIVGVEALVRWNNPERGLLPPADFVPVAEETGQIVPIGRWVLGEACRQARRWQVAFPSQPPLMVSVNLSARQLQRGELVDDVVEALDGAGLEPASLLLEITESVLMQDTEESLRTLRALKALGVRVAMDDFGTGYSSLSYLRSFPVDVLKVAKPFVDELSKGEEQAAFVEAMVQLGHRLRLAIVAEGIETAEQAAQLRRLGADMGQGYHLARPLPSEHMEALLAGFPGHGTCRPPRAVVLDAGLQPPGHSLVGTPAPVSGIEIVGADRPQPAGPAGSAA